MTATRLDSMAHCRMCRRRATLDGDQFTQFWTTADRLKIGTVTALTHLWPPFVSCAYAARPAGLTHHRRHGVVCDHGFYSVRAAELVA